MHLYKPMHFAGPFLGHAIGTLVAAFLASKIGASNQKMLALLMGIVFLAGGITMVMQLPAPVWFSALDLIVAYIPMALLGWKLAGSPNQKKV